MSINIGHKSYINQPYFTGDYGQSIKNTETRPEIKIGRYTSIGKNLQFVFTHHDYTATSTHPLFSKEYSRGHVTIGHDIWIGLNVTLMDNITIGHGAVVGASSVVTKDVPPYAIVVGNPARIVKYRFTPEIIERFLRSEWWLKDEHELINLGIKTKSPTEFLDTFELVHMPSA